MVNIQLSTPNNQTVFRISDAPQMPTVRVDATTVPATPSSAKAQFRWTIQLRFAGSETRHGKPGTPVDMTKTTTGGQLVLNPTDWRLLRGGTLTVGVTTVINGQTGTAQLQGLRILGTNPTPAAVKAALGTDALRRIAHQESNFCQFGNDSWPLFSSDDLGGAGIMQITPASEDQRWNWRSNIKAGVDKYNHCYNLGPTFVQSVRGSSQFSALVTALNLVRAKQHLPSLTIALPEWSADQRMRDAIRGYNGWAGQDPVVPSLHLHEYKLARDTNGQMQITVSPNTNRAEAIWVQVPSTERPQVGDPNYVAHVLAQTP